MAKPINWSKDGVVFINFLKPAVKWAQRFPGLAKVIVAGVAVLAATGYVIYRRCNDKEDGENGATVPSA